MLKYGVAKQVKEDSKDGLSLSILETAIHQLENDFEGYFSGLTKVPPLKELELLSKKVRNFPLQTLNNTEKKFRFQNLQGRFQTLSAYWTRMLREIEEGIIPRRGVKVAVHKKQPSLPSAQNPLDLLYQKLRNLSAIDDSTSSKNDFLRSIEKKVAVLKEKDPTKSVAFKVVKNDSGKYEVKIGYKKSKTDDSKIN